MATGRFLRAEIASDLAILSGSAYAGIPDIVDIRETRRVRGERTLELLLPKESSAASFIAEGRVIKTIFSDGTFDEWRIAEIDEKREGLTVYTTRVLGNDPIVDLGQKSVISRLESNGTRNLTFEGIALTIAQQLSSYILKAMQDEGFTHFIAGTIDKPTAVFDVVYDWSSPLSACLQLAERSGLEFQIRKVTVAGPDLNKYALDFVTRVGSSAATLYLFVGKNLQGLRRLRSTTEQANRIYFKGADLGDGIRASIQDARWKVAAISGAGPYDLQLADPLGGDGPVGFDNQLDGKYLLLVDETTLRAISACNVAAQSVTVSSIAGIAVNDYVRIRQNAAGDEIIFLEDPASITQYGLKVGVIDRPDIPDTYNLVLNGALRSWSAGLPVGFRSVRTPTAAPTITQTTTAARWRVGGNSARLQCTGDGQGLETDYLTVRPTTTRPIFSGHYGFWIESGQARVQLIAAVAAVSVSTLTRVSQTCTCTTAAPHGLAVGDYVEIVGATQNEYNDIFTVTAVASSTIFTFECTGSPATPATGTITSRKVWVLPTNIETDGQNISFSLKQWDALGAYGFELFVKAATVLKLRITQAGTANLDCYVDYGQITQTPENVPFLEGSGATQGWQATNVALQKTTDPQVTLEVELLDLGRFDTSRTDADVVLGGNVVIHDTILGVDASTRILELERILHDDLATRLVLSNRPEDVTDALVRPRPPKRLVPTIGLGILPDVSAYFTNDPQNPAMVSVRLVGRPSTGAIYYVVQDKNAAIPPQGAASWQLYSTPFTQNQDQTLDLQLAAYVKDGGRYSPIRVWSIDRDAIPSIALTLTESPANRLFAAVVQDDDVRSWRFYERTGSGAHWPVTTYSVGITRSGSTATATVSGLANHKLVVGDLVFLSGATQPEYNGSFVVTALPSLTQFQFTVTGTPATPATGSPIFSSPRSPVDETYFIREMRVDLAGGGITAAGSNVKGGTTYADSSTVRTTGNTTRGIAVPFNSDNVTLEQYRGFDEITYAGSVTPTISDFLAEFTTEGTACDATNGATVQCTWAANSAVVDGTHDLDIYMGVNGVDFGVIATETAPKTNLSKSFIVPFKHTTGKWDPQLTFNFTFELRDGGGVVQAGAAPSRILLSTCPLA